MTNPLARHLRMILSWELDPGPLEDLGGSQKGLAVVVEAAEPQPDHYGLHLDGD